MKKETRAEKLRKSPKWVAAQEKNLAKGRHMKSPTKGMGSMTAEKRQEVSQLGVKSRLKSDTDD